MELATLDSELKRVRVVEGYESLIWTERFAAYGDFELHIPESREARTLLPIGTRLVLDRSTRVMEVETIEDSTNDDGARTLKFKGRSMETIFENRLGWHQLGPTQIPDPEDAEYVIDVKWEISKPPHEIMHEMFQTVCVTKALHPGDGIPFYTPGNYTPAGNIPFSTEAVKMQFEPDTLYNSLKKVADTYNLGFRLVRAGDTSRIYFEVYSGSNRLSSQTVLPAVVFSPELENLTDISQLTSDANYKNVAYVLAKNGSSVVYGVGADPTSSGFERRVLMVNASNIDLPAGDALQAALQQRGLEELAKHRRVYTFDGEIPENGRYAYGVDYSLGDLVEQRNADGFGNEMRVTEQIFVSDAEGDRSYPTLSLNTTVNPGTWASWTGNQTWSEVGADVYWANV